VRWARTGWSLGVAAASALALIVLLSVGLSGCSKSGGGALGDAGGAGQSGGDADAGQSGDDAGAAGQDGECPTDALPASGPPPQVKGCYVGTTCWQKVPCNCELDIVNPAASVASVRVALTVKPATATPSLAGCPEVSVAFDDPDGGWYAVWAAQAGAATTFAVSRTAPTTTVTLAAASVALAAVPLPASASSTAWAVVVGAPPSTTLDLEAVVIDGAANPIATSRGSCVEVLPP
jgi:hypothetical protein